MRAGHVNDIAHVGSTLVAALRDLGQDAVLIDPPKPGGSLPYPAKAFTWPLRAGIEIATGLDLRRRGFDVVHIHYASHAVLGPLGGSPFVVHCHGSDVRSLLARRVGIQFGRTTLRRAVRVYVATPDLLALVRRLRPDAEFLPNPIDVQRFTGGAGEAATRDLLVGVRLDPAKGADRIARILGGLRRERPETTVTIIDAGPDVARIHAAAGLVPGVEVVPRARHESMPDLIRRHRVAIGQLGTGAVGQYELEVMACGVPLVGEFQYAGSYPTPPPIVDASSDPAAVEAIVGLLDHPDRRNELGRSSAAWVRRHHAAERIAERILADDTLIVAGTT